ncbi:MAG: hypothetical protein HYW25_01805 [Candidatus Aenigmarchaeota archaeon]|nr:hypothetical protein [Candidatus Aenigmarchaeota archaeon]
MSAPYRRGYSHTKERGQEKKINCGFCGKLVPKWKTFAVEKTFRISDPLIKKNVDMRRVSMWGRKVYACPGCARFRGIVQINRSRTSRPSGQEQ